MIKQGALRGDKIKYPDGVGCCVWYPMPGDDEGMGLCFDFAADDLDDFIALLQAIKDAPAEDYKQ